MDEKKKDSTNEIQAAIEILEAFSRGRESKSSLSLLKKTIAFAKDIFTISTDSQIRVQRALDTLKSNASLIQEMEKGSTPQKNLASSAYAAIDRFNALGQQLKKRPLPWRRWMEQLHVEIPRDNISNPKIELSHKFHFIEPEKAQYRPSLFIDPSLTKNDLQPSPFELDAFRMKAITLLKHQEIRFTSLTDELKLIREVPIVVQESPSLSQTFKESIIAMQQTLSTLPGETIELKGSFKRYPQSNCHSVPIPESFRIKTEIHQTGFPHPSQRNGWSVSPLLLPSEGIAHEMRIHIAKELQPHGKWNQQAKETLKLKKLAFEANLDEFVMLHRRLNQKMLNNIYQDCQSILDTFYEVLSKNPHPYQYLSDIHQQILICAFEKKPCSHFIRPAEQAFIDLLTSMYQKISIDNAPFLRDMAYKQLHEFYSELVSPPNAKEIHSSLLNSLANDIYLWD